MKKGFTLTELIGVVIILALLALLSFPSILKMMKGTKIELSEASKEILYNATDNYIKDNPNAFFRNNGNVYCISVETLTKNNYLSTKIYDSTTGNELPQDSLVEAKYDHDKFDYVLNNDCIESISQPSSLISVLLSQYSEGNETGLLKDEENSNLYYYSGTNEDVNNNHLWYGGHHWRVIEFDTNEKTLTLISQQPLTAIQPTELLWDSKEKYDKSYVSNWLNEYFYNSLDNSVKNNIKENILNIGIYTNVGEITTTKKVGLLDADKYNRAGGAKSFLDIEDFWWLSNRYNDFFVSSVNYNGKITSGVLSTAHGVRPVIKILDIAIEGGNGTLDNNYRTADISTSTSNIKIGEYINVPYLGNDNACGIDKKCTFRVVSKDSNSIKVILNGLLPSNTIFGSNSTITTNHNVYQVLNSFSNNISSTYRYTNNKVWYIGSYTRMPSRGVNFENVKNETLSVSTGLPTVAEMFSGNDIDIGINKIFVDINTIENPNVNDFFWMMNRYDTTYVNFIYDNGSLMGVSISGTLAVRPVIYLKAGSSAIQFIDGNGTAQNPYEIQ